MQIFRYLKENWEPVLAYLTALASVGVYFVSRATDRAWRRTEFLFQQAHYLDNDSELKDVIAVLDDRHPSASVDLVFGPSSTLDKPTRDAIVLEFDKLLNLFQRLAYAVLKSRTLTEKEIAPFSWYIQKTLGHPLLVKYCDENGFDDLVELAKCLGLDVAQPHEPGGTCP